jgi:hypothetical protein
VQRTAKVLRSPRYCFRLLQRSFTVQRFRPKPAAWEIVPVEIDALVPIRESDLEATKAWDGLASCLTMRIRFDIPTYRPTVLCPPKAQEILRRIGSSTQTNTTAEQTIARAAVSTIASSDVASPAFGRECDFRTPIRR